MAEPIVTDHYVDGKLLSWTNDFAKEGDRIPPHSHTWDTQHDIRVERGAVEVLGVILGPGDSMDIDSDRWHTVRALEDDTRTLHFLLHP